MVFAMNALKMVFVWIVSIVFFFHKEIWYTNKTETKDELQYANKKLSVTVDKIIYAPEDLKMKGKHSTFYKSFFSS